MAHELSIQNGQAEAIYSGERKSVWHGLGQYLGDRSITVEELRGVVGIPVAKVPTFFRMPTADGDSYEKASAKAFLTVRMDTGEELASVGPDYTVVQHDTALVECILPILDAGFATIDVAGLLRQGLGGWTLLRWDLDKMDPTIREVYRDEIQAYGLCLSWHGEGNANSYANVTERAVCKNTIDAGMANASMTTRIRHTAGIAARQVEAARRSFAHIVAHHKSMAEAYTALQHTVLTRALWKELVANVAAPDPETRKDWNPDAPRAELVKERHRTKVQRLFHLWHSGTGHSGDMSAWEAYNGLVESIDHDVDLWKVRNPEDRAIKVTSGEFGKIRQAVFSGLVNFARTGELTTA